MSEDLKALFPIEVVEVTGGQVKAHPFYFGQLSRVAKLCKPIVEALISSGIMTITSNTDNTSTIKIDNDFIPKLFQIMSDATEPVLCLVAFAVDKPRDWLDSLPVDDGIRLTTKIWEVNSDFFVKRVMPMLVPMLKSKLTTSDSTGGISSPASSAPVTDASISMDTH